jgi:O-antigen/teichoic acid export membrane protein
VSRVPDRTERVLAGWLWLSTGSGIQGLLTVLTVAVLARLLTPADFGIVSAALLASNFSRVLPESVVGAALIQRPDLRPAHVRTAVSIALLTGVGTLVLLWILAPMLGTFFRIPALPPVLRTLACIQPVLAIGMVPEALLRRALRFRAVAHARAVSSAVGYGGLGTGLALLGARHWALVGGSVAQSMVMTALVLRAERCSLRPGLEGRAARELMSFSGGFLLARIGNYAAGNGDNLVVARWLGAAALGVYDRAYQLMAAPAMLLGQALDEVLFPAIAQVQADRPLLATAYRRAVTAVGLVMLPASVVLYVLAPELVVLLLGPGWTAVTVPFRILALGLLFRTSYKISDAFARALGAVYRRAWRQWMFAGLVIGGAVAGQRYGTAGVAWAVVLALAINFLLQAHLILRLVALDWRAFAGAHAPAVRVALLVGVPVAAGASASRTLLGLPPAATLALASTLGAATLWASITIGGARLFGPEGSWLFLRLAALRRRLRAVPLAGGTP